MRVERRRGGGGGEGDRKGRRRRVRGREREDVIGRGKKWEEGEDKAVSGEDVA